MRVRIYQPSRSAMQSGRAKTQDWILEAELETARTPEPIMGWVSAGDTMNELSMKFSSKENAISFAEKNGWEYDVEAPKLRKVKPKNYGDNFVD